MTYRWIIGGIIALALLAGGWLLLGFDTDQAAPAGSGSEERGGADPRPAVGPNVAVPDLTLKDFAGNEVVLASLQGKPAVINSWAAWCPFCVAELPEFVKAKESLGDTVTFVAIDRAESQTIAQKFADDLGVTDDLLFLLDPRDSFYQSIGGFSMPETLFVNSDGSVNFHKRGPMEAPEIVERAQQLN